MSSPEGVDRPLRRDAFLVVEESDGRYFWPTYETRKTEGAIGG